jgi:hypothetical protein
MIPSKPDLSAAHAKELMLALAGEGSSLHRREAVSYCHRNNINIDELRELARKVTAGRDAKR